jgi:hypothetical protein
MRACLDARRDSDALVQIVRNRSRARRLAVLSVRVRLTLRGSTLTGRRRDRGLKARCYKLDQVKQRQTAVPMRPNSYVMSPRLSASLLKR